MPNKTEDIEFEIRVALGSGPLTLAGLEAGGRFAWLDDRRWLGVAVHKMLGDGRMVAVNCEAGHNHGGDCLVELAGAR